MDRGKDRERSLLGWQGCPKSIAFVAGSQPKDVEVKVCSLIFPRERQRRLSKKCLFPRVLALDCNRHRGRNALFLGRFLYSSKRVVVGQVEGGGGERREGGDNITKRFWPVPNEKNEEIYVRRVLSCFFYASTLAAYKTYVKRVGLAILYRSFPPSHHCKTTLSPFLAPPPPLTRRNGNTWEK